MQFLRHLYSAVRLRFALVMLGVGCLLWTVLAVPLGLVLPSRWGMWVGRWMATLGFRAYIWLLDVIGLGRFDITALDALRGAGPLILAVNHPGLLDALMVLSRLPNVTCIFKASLMRNPLWGAGARLAGYIRNDLFLGAELVSRASLEKHLLVTEDELFVRFRGVLEGVYDHGAFDLLRRSQV